MTLFARLLPLELSFQRAKPLSGDHRMAALLISSFFPTNGVADCYSGNHQGKNHHELREHLKVTHDSVPPFTFVERCEGKAKSQAPSVVLQAMEPFHRLRDYYIMSNYTSQAFRTTFQHVRFGGWRRGRVRFCVNILALKCFPRGVRWGCAPQTAPKSHWLSGLSSFGS